MKNIDKIADQVGNGPILQVDNDPILTVIPDLIGDLIRIIWKREYRPTW